MQQKLHINKIHKAINSAKRALENLEKDNKHLAIGDLKHVEENALEAILIIKAIIEQESEIIKN